VPENGESANVKATVSISYHLDWSVNMTDSKNFDSIEYSYAPIDESSLLPQDRFIEALVGQTYSFDPSLPFNSCLYATFPGYPNPLDPSLPASTTIRGEATMWIELGIAEIIPVPEPPIIAFFSSSMIC